MRLVQGSDSNESETDSPVVAPHGDPAGPASIDVVRPTALGGHRDCLRIPGDLHARRLDERVEYERTSRLALAHEAMAAVHEHRSGKEAIAHRTTRASAFELSLHGTLLAFHRALDDEARVPASRWLSERRCSRSTVYRPT